MLKGVDPALSVLRKQAKANELTYSFVMDCLSDYKSPRAKLTQLLKSQALIRVKKGLYVFNHPLIQGDVCKELLANLIFGPSYVSLEWAMSYYGMIPERVEEVTSITFKRKKEFITPLGRFSYFHCHPKRYPIGVTQVEYTPYQKYLIATKEKALCDLLVIRRGKVDSLKQMENILFQDFRIEEEDLLDIDMKLVTDIYQELPHSSIHYLIKILEKLTHE